MDESWNEVTRKIISCCMRIHRELGPGLLESVYDDCLAVELGDEGLSFERQSPVPVLYKGLLVGTPLRLDFLVEGGVVVEVKAVEGIHPVHKAQVLSYLRLTASPVGLLVNFNVPLLKDGVCRFLAKEEWVRVGVE